LVSLDRVWRRPRKRFEKPVFEVIAIDAERTFWEKATILHQGAHRPGAIPARYSRHYYDLYRLSESPIRRAALANFTLLKSVIEFKEWFYYSSWARYDLALSGSFRLSPPDSQLPARERDYRAGDSGERAISDQFDQSRVARFKRPESEKVGRNRRSG
jgi:hypothetical protein